MVRIQGTADDINHRQTVHGLSLFQSLQVDMIQAILGVQLVNHSLLNGLYHYYTVIEIGFFVHVVNNPVHERTEEIPLSKLDDSFRTDRLSGGLFVQCFHTISLITKMLFCRPFTGIRRAKVFPTHRQPGVFQRITFTFAR